MGTSNHMLLMHDHNYLASSQGGKNLTRFIPPGGAKLYQPTYEIEAGTRVEPNGAVYAPLFRGAIPWDAHDDKSVDCSGAALLNDLGVHTNYSCVSAVDLGTSFNWYPGVTAAVWRGDTDKHCLLCRIPGKSTTWNYTDEKGAITYVKDNVEADRIQKDMLDGFDMDKDGRIDEHDFALSMKAAARPSTESAHQTDGFGRPLKKRKTNAERASAYQTHKVNALGPSTQYEDLSTQHAQMRTGVKSDGGLSFIIKNFNYGQGMNFSWTLLPAHLAGLNSFMVNPANNSILYGISPTCIAESYDTGDTWTACWNKTGLEGVRYSQSGLVWKDEKVGFVGATSPTGSSIPYKTVDGGETWAQLNSGGVLATASFTHQLMYSWTGKTLAMSGAGGSRGLIPMHPHAGYLWTSTDDGETWVRMPPSPTLVLVCSRILLCVVIAPSNWRADNIQQHPRGATSFYADCMLMRDKLTYTLLFFLTKIVS